MESRVAPIDDTMINTLAKHAITTLALLLSLTGCTYVNCAVARPGGEPLIALHYMSAGDAPTAVSLTVYGGAYRDPSKLVLELEPLGLQRRCRMVRSERLDELLEDVDFLALQEAAFDSGSDVGAHEAMLSVTVSRRTTQRVPDEFDAAYLARLAEVEDVFRAEFPRLMDRFLPFSLHDSIDLPLGHEEPSHEP